MIREQAWMAAITRRLRLALSLIVVLYTVLLGGSFAASIVYAAQALNFAGSAALTLGWLVVRLAQRRRVALTGLEWPLLIFAGSQWLALLFSMQPRLGLDWAATV